MEIAILSDDEDILEAITKDTMGAIEELITLIGIGKLDITTHKMERELLFDNVISLFNALAKTLAKENYRCAKVILRNLRIWCSCHMPPSPLESEIYYEYHKIIGMHRDLLGSLGDCLMETCDISYDAARVFSDMHSIIDILSHSSMTAGVWFEEYLDRAFLVRPGKVFGYLDLCEKANQKIDIEPIDVSYITHRVIAAVVTKIESHTASTKYLLDIIDFLAPYTSGTNRQLPESTKWRLSELLIRILIELINRYYMDKYHSEDLLEALMRRLEPFFGSVDMSKDAGLIADLFDVIYRTHGDIRLIYLACKILDESKAIAKKFILRVKALVSDDAHERQRVMDCLKPSLDSILTGDGASQKKQIQICTALTLIMEMQNSTLLKESIIGSLGENDDMWLHMQQILENAAKFNKSKFFAGLLALSGPNGALYSRGDSIYGVLSIIMKFDDAGAIINALIMLKNLVDSKEQKGLDKCYVFNIANMRYQKLENPIFYFLDDNNLSNKWRTEHLHDIAALAIQLHLSGFRKPERWLLEWFADTLRAATSTYKGVLLRAMINVTEEIVEEPEIHAFLMRALADRDCSNGALEVMLITKYSWYSWSDMKKLVELCCDHKLVADVLRKSLVHHYNVPPAESDMDAVDVVSKFIIGLYLYHDQATTSCALLQEYISIGDKVITSVCKILNNSDCDKSVVVMTDLMLLCNKNMRLLKTAADSIGSEKLIAMAYVLVERYRTKATRGTIDSGLLTLPLAICALIDGRGLSAKYKDCLDIMIDCAYLCCAFDNAGKTWSDLREKFKNIPAIQGEHTWFTKCFSGDFDTCNTWNAILIYADDMKLKFSEPPSSTLNKVRSVWHKASQFAVINGRINQ